MPHSFSKGFRLLRRVSRDTAVTFGLNADAMKSLRDSLGAVLGQVAVDLRSGAPLTPIWNDVVGELIARHSRVRSLERGVLTVTCEPAWRAALEGERGTLLVKLRARLGESALSSVVFES